EGQKDPLGLVSGIDANGNEVVLVSSKSGKLPPSVVSRLRPDEYPVETPGKVPNEFDAEQQALQAAWELQLERILVASRPNYVCVECQLMALRTGADVVSPTRAGRFASELL